MKDNDTITKEEFKFKLSCGLAYVAKNFANDKINSKITAQCCALFLVGTGLEEDDISDIYAEGQKIANLDLIRDGGKKE